MTTKRLPCWLVGHRRVPGTQFMRRLDGYPLAAYTACRNCNRRLHLTYGRQSTPAFRPDLAAKWAEAWRP